MIPPEHLKIETGKPPNEGGQRVGVPDTIVIVTHIPTLTRVSIQMHRSQWKNKQTAIEMIEWALTSL